MATHYYKVTTRTGDMGGAGTDANVRITLYGDSGTLEEAPGKGIVLDNPGDDREKGDTDTYTLSSQEGPLGKICAIKLEHDNAGKGSGWYVKDVTVVALGTTSKPSLAQLPKLKSFTFPVDRWLAKDESDHNTFVTIGNVPSLTVIAPAKQYVSLKLGLHHAALYTPSSPGLHKMTRQSISELTISTSTTNSKKDTDTTVTTAETSVSYMAISAKLSVSKSVAKEIFESATNDYKSASSETSISEETIHFTPQTGHVVGVAFYTYRSVASGQLGIADRRFDYSHSSTEWLQPTPVTYVDGSPELAKFKADHARFLSVDA